VEKGSRDVSSKRADGVRRYLTEVWQIDGSRLVTKSQGLPSSPANNNSPDGQAENRRVELYSTEFDVLKPVSIRDVTVESNPPIVEIVPKVIAEAGIRDWHASIVQDNSQLRTMKGNSSPDLYTWNVTDKPYPKLEQPVSVSYVVTDNTGQRKDATAAIKVQQLTLKKKRYIQKDDKRIDRFSLIVFDYNKADLNADNKKIVKDVQARIQPESQITIAGYADRSGEPDYNRELARKRCVEVQKSVGLTDANSVIQPIGSDTLLYDNSTPEGRAYSRTVQIVIETPVK
jgi:outer membrane protein OmpA-like peptidoglycan-associated protein